MELSNKILSDITVYMKYAKFVPELNRRETWVELVDRNKAMHIKKYPELAEKINEAYKLVYDKRFYQACARYNSEVNRLKLALIVCITALIYQLITLIVFTKQCSCFLEEQVLDILYKNIT